MRVPTRAAPPHVAGGHRGEHACAVSDSDADQRQLATAFVRDEPAVDDEVRYRTDAVGPHAVVALLRAGAVPVDDAPASGRLVARSAGESCPRPVVRCAVTLLGPGSGVKVHRS